MLFPLLLLRLHLGVKITFLSPLTFFFSFLPRLFHSFSSPIWGFTVDMLRSAPALSELTKIMGLAGEVLKGGTFFSCDEEGAQKERNTMVFTFFFSFQMGIRIRDSVVVELQ